MYRYYPKGTCSKEIDIEIEDGKVVSCQFHKGCKGNLQGVSRLIAGMEIDQVIQKLKGIQCQGNTSCPDQLARALETYKDETEDKKREEEEN